MRAVTAFGPVRRRATSVHVRKFEYVQFMCAATRASLAGRVRRASVSACGPTIGGPIPFSPSVGHFRRSRSQGCMPGLAVPSFSVRSDSHLCSKSSFVVPDRRPSLRKASSAGNGPLQRFGHRRRAFLNNSQIAVGMPAVFCRLSISTVRAQMRKVAISDSPSCGDRDSALRSLRRTLWPSRPARHCLPGVPWTPGCRGIQSPSGNSEDRPLPEH